MGEVNPITHGSAGKLMTVDLKCLHKSRHAVLSAEDGWVEVKCDRSHCGAGRGKVVLHRFNLITGELIETLQFAEPHKKEGTK